MDVPELSYGQNPRLPSASVGIDLQFSPERGRYFVATQDLKPGNTLQELCSGSKQQAKLELVINLLSNLVPAIWDEIKSLV